MSSPAFSLSPAISANTKVIMSRIVPSPVSMMVFKTSIAAVTYGSICVQSATMASQTTAHPAITVSPFSSHHCFSVSKTPNKGWKDITLWAVPSSILSNRRSRKSITLSMAGRIVSSTTGRIFSPIRSMNESIFTPIFSILRETVLSIV